MRCLFPGGWDSTSTSSPDILWSATGRSLHHSAHQESHILNQTCQGFLASLIRRHRNICINDSIKGEKMGSIPGGIGIDGESRSIGGGWSRSKGGDWMRDASSLLNCLRAGRLGYPDFIFLYPLLKESLVALFLKNEEWGMLRREIQNRILLFQREEYGKS